VRRVAAAGVVLQLVVDGGQGPVVRVDGVEEGACRAEGQRRQVWIVVQPLDARDVLTSGTTAVVAHAVEAHKGIDRGLHLRGTAADMGLQVVAPARVGEGDAKGEDAGAVAGLPPEEASGQSLFVGTGAHEDVEIETAGFQDLG